MTRDEFEKLTTKTSELKPTLVRGLGELTLQLLLLSLGVGLSFGSLWLWVPGQLLLGICFWRSFAIMHACGHHAFSSYRKLDDVIGLLMSLFCFIPYFAWKFIHQDHHKWTGWIDRDPTMRNVLKKKNSGLLRFLDMAWWCWIPVISIHYIVSVFFKVSLHKTKKKVFVLSGIILLLSFHIGLMILMKDHYVKIFGLSAFIYLNLGDLSLLTQHVHLPMDHSDGLEVTPKKSYEQADFSHTMILPTFASRWIIMGFNHHALHHIVPRVPYYATDGISYRGKHTHDWKEWILKAKKARVSELIYPVNKS